METSNSFIEQLREKYEIFELWRNAVGVCYKIEIKVGVYIELSISVNFDKRYKITKEDKELWLTALRSGKFNQATLRLQSPKGYCCLGVWAYCQENPTFEEVIPMGLKNYGIYSKSLDVNDKLALEIQPTGNFVGFSVDGFASLAGLNDDNSDFIKTSWVIEHLF